MRRLPIFSPLCTFFSRLASHLYSHSDGFTFFACSSSVSSRRKSKTFFLKTSITERWKPDLTRCGSDFIVLCNQRRCHDMDHVTLVRPTTNGDNSLVQLVRERDQFCVLHTYYGVLRWPSVRWPNRRALFSIFLLLPARDRDFVDGRLDDLHIDLHTCNGWKSCQIRVCESLRAKTQLWKDKLYVHIFCPFLFVVCSQRRWKCILLLFYPFDFFKKVLHFELECTNWGNESHGFGVFFAWNFNYLRALRRVKIPVRTHSPT